MSNMLGQTDFMGTPPDQFRMRRLQVFNWGTFDGRHDIPIAERGYLFVGKSGSGKTTLLDAISALLIPPKWTRFNAAAREAEKTARDRDLVSYIRGAWADQKDSGSGEITTQYLRSGTTWSAIAVTFCDQDNKAITLLQMFTLRGTDNNSSSIKRNFMIADRNFDLTELEPFSNHLDLRKLKHELQELFYAASFSQYCERFRRYLGIENESVLRLLHKTQSAKNLGDLNTFLRDYMLEEPPTFNAAKQLVDEFAELNEAHKAVLKARQQVQILEPARAANDQLGEAIRNRDELSELKSGLDAFFAQHKARLLLERAEQLKTELEGLDAKVAAQQATLKNTQDEVSSLESQYRDAGGGQIENLERERALHEKQRDSALRSLDRVKGACEALKWATPDTPTDFAQMLSDARTQTENWQTHLDILREKQGALMGKLAKSEEELTSVRAEVESLRRQPSNIPRKMLNLRAEIAAALGISETILPFVGELIQVRPDHAAWTGAVERVLHNFALSVLVDERNYRAASEHINKTSLNGGRIVYHRTEQPINSQPRGHSINSILGKLELKTDRKTYSAWLKCELDKRFDFDCVDTMDAFRKAENALTMQGQVKHAHRHEKDDRYDVADRSRWVLGFDNTEKLLLYERKAQELTEKIAAIKSDLQTLRLEEQQGHDKRRHIDVLSGFQWSDIDAAAPADRIASLSRQIDDIRKDSSSLEELQQRIRQTKLLRKQHEDTLVNLRSKNETAKNKLRGVEQEHSRTFKFCTENPLPDWQCEALQRRLERAGVFNLTLDNLEGRAKTEERAINDEIRELERQINKNEKLIESKLVEFKRRWPEDCSNMDATLQSTTDYLALLNRVETDGLPGYEHRFFELLQKQSQQNLVALSQHLHHARQDIFIRISQVNESLGKSEYNPGTHLQVQIKDRGNPDIIAFRQEVKRCVSIAVSENREEAEGQFLAIRSLVERLESQEPDKIRWRNLVLDVRQHVEFTPVELDEQGEEQEVYRSGAGKSGGQRQKLATTVMAAALRYQLCGDERSIPKYAPVVLDEAFDKADNEFTEQAMAIFEQMGFQMIVATPLKSVMTLESFIGGACFVQISDRRKSVVNLIEYDEVRQRLSRPEAYQEDEPVAQS